MSTKQLAASLALAALLAWPAGGRAQQGKHAEMTTVIAVEVPVQVLVDGKPVRGLTAENFELLDGRKASALTGFEVVDLAVGGAGAAVPAPAAAPSAPPAAGRRHFLMLLDLSNSEPTAIGRARQAVRQVVANQLHPSDLVAVATYRTGPGAQLLLGFTSDRRQVDIALETLGNEKFFERNADALRLVVADVLGGSVATPGGRAAGAGAEATDAAMMEALADMARAEDLAHRQNQAARIGFLTKNLGELGRLMSGVEGRKYVVYLSQGFDSQLLTGTTDATEIEETARASESGEIWKIDSSARYGDTRVQNQLEAMLEEFRRADCVIQAVDIGGIVTGADQRPRASGRETLFTMAKGTGGQLFENFSDLGGAMSTVLESTSVTYLLTFQPEGLKLDGKFRSIKVRLKNVPGRPTVVHRPGYYAPRPYDEWRPAERQVDSAQLVLTGEPGGALDAGAVVVPLRHDRARAWVPVVIEVSGQDLLARAEKGQVQTELFVYAVDAAGTIADWIGQSLQLDLAKVGERLRQGGLKVAGSLFVPPGEYSLRILVRAAPSGDYALRDVKLSVPDFQAGGAFASPALFPTPMTSGLVARATATNRPQDPMFPFVLGKDEFYLPSALPRLAAGRVVRLCSLAYGLAAGDLKLSAQVIDQAGREVLGGKLTPVERAVFEQPGLERLTFDFEAPAPLPAGDYQLRLRVVDGRGASVASSASFRAEP